MFPEHCQEWFLISEPEVIPEYHHCNPMGWRGNTQFGKAPTTLHPWAFPLNQCPLQPRIGDGFPAIPALWLLGRLTQKLKGGKVRQILYFSPLILETYDISKLCFHLQKEKKLPVAHQKLKHSKILKIAISTFTGKFGFKLDLSYFRASKLDFVCFDNPHRRQMT